MSPTSDPPSPFATHARAVDELIDLEQRQLERELSERERERWRTLTAALFGWPTDQRRRYLRVNAQREGRIIGPRREGPVTVTNLSAGGLFLQSSIASPELIGDELELELQLPVEHVQTIRARVRVCWVEPQRTNGQPGMGVEFVELCTQHRVAVLDHCRQHLLALLELSEQKYQFFFEHSVDVAMLLDSEGAIRRLNVHGAKLLGRTVAQLLGTRLDALVAPEAREPFRVALGTMRNTGRVRLPLHFLLASGRTLPVDVNLVPLSIAGCQLGTIAVAHDLLERERVAEQQRELERKLFQADKLATIGQIAASVAHDINNPLAYMHTNLTMLHEYLDPLKQLVRSAIEATPEHSESLALLVDIDADLTDLVEDTLEGSRRIRDILRELRDFSRVEGDVKIRVDINKAVDTSVQVVKNLIKHRARLVREFGNGLPQTYCNFGRLTQVLLNLLSNAAQAFDSPDVERNVITVRTAFADDALTIEVADNGRGIDAETLPHVFERFFTTRRSSGGTGLGLVIAKENVESLDGTLSVQSTAGTGTCFTVTLPAQRPSRPADEHTSFRAPSGAIDRVLVIDDEPGVLRSMKRILSRFYQVALTTSPVEALDLLSDQSFSVILCDLMVPEMDGFRFRQKLAEQRPDLLPRLVFITGGTFTAAEEADLRALDNVVLHKPVETPELLSIVSRTIRLAE